MDEQPHFASTPVFPVEVSAFLVLPLGYEFPAARGCDRDARSVTERHDPYRRGGTTLLLPAVRKMREAAAR